MASASIFITTISKTGVVCAPTHWLRNMWSSPQFSPQPYCNPCYPDKHNTPSTQPCPSPYMIFSTKRSMLLCTPFLFQPTNRTPPMTLATPGEYSDIPKQMPSSKSIPHPLAPFTQPYPKSCKLPNPKPLTMSAARNSLVQSIPPTFRSSQNPSGTSRHKPSGVFIWVLLTSHQSCPTHTMSHTSPSPLSRVFFYRIPLCNLLEHQHHIV